MNSTVIKPTVGRKVWYRPSKHDQQGPVPMQCAVGHPLDATVIAVHGDRLVNVLVTDMVGRQFPVLSVTLVQKGDILPACNEGLPLGRYVEWMPYQQGQAAKAEVADKGIVLEPKYREPTQREQLEYALVSGAASALAISPGNARQVVDGIKVVLDMLYPIAATPTSGPDNAHAAAVLYPAIERAMGELSKLHEGFNMEVNRAFNILRDAFWSECPAPASAVPKRRETADAEH